MKSSRRFRRWSSALLLPLSAACYTYTPLPSLAPVPDTHVALVLTDLGRVGAGPSMGAGVAKIEGALVGSTDSEYTLRITDVTDVRGRESRWNGERLSVRRAWVDNAYEKRFSKPRTYLLVGALTVGAATFIATRHLLGGGSAIQPPGGGGGGSNQ